MQSYIIVLIKTKSISYVAKQLHTHDQAIVFLEKYQGGILFLFFHG